MKRRILRHFLRQDTGATAIEFALVAIPFFLLLIGIVEYGLFMMTKVAVESIVAQAAQAAADPTDRSLRFTGCDRVCILRRFVEEKSAHLINSHGTTITTRNLSHGEATPFAGDLCLCGVAHIGGACPCGQYENLGGTDAYEAGPTSFSVGRSGELIEVQITYPWQVLNPIMRPFFSPGGIAIIRATAVVKNE